MKSVEPCYAMKTCSKALAVGIVWFFYDNLHRNFVNSFLPDQNGHHATDDIFICIFVNETLSSLITISLKFVLKRPIDNNTALV